MKGIINFELLDWDQILTEVYYAYLVRLKEDLSVKRETSVNRTAINLHRYDVPLHLSKKTL
jgi:hypothetical protein